VLLANDFQKAGERHFNNKEYSEALRAFEHALEITQRPAFGFSVDTNLVYNTALAAYEARKWDKAAQYLKRLHEYDYSPNVAHLLYNASLAKGDTLSGKNVLRQGIDKYQDNEALVLLLADLHLLREEYASAVLVLDQAILRDSANFVYHNTKGMIYQRIEDFENAITAYKDAVELAPDQHMIYLNLATCYYNIGVDIEESTRTMTNISLVLRERQKSSAAFEQAVQWLDKVYEKEPDDQEVLRRLHELYRMLRIYDKVLSLEQKIR
jgi:tetratricopeptide (TPR) repeat protein